jgi:hypothetical protein
VKCARDFVFLANFSSKHRMNFYIYGDDEERERDEWLKRNFYDLKIVRENCELHIGQI